MADEKADAEVDAIQTLLKVLEPLASPARENVISYVFRRLGIAAPSASPSDEPRLSPSRDAKQDVPPAPVSAGPQRDIRSLGEEKQPKTVNERLAVVAYYLAHLAPQSERRDYITSEDIKRYFVQANFPLPGGPPRIRLFNARKAGYFDQRQHGRYQLNPVGYNLVAHRLPATAKTGTQTKKDRARQRPKRKAAKKSRK
jgi:hypothetical protein